MAMNQLRSRNSSTTRNPVSDACKMTKLTDVASSEDLISRLPDEILTHILSLIPTKLSVATSVLSKRWIHVWTLVPRLDFCHNGRTHPVEIAQFTNFVDRVLHLNKVLSVRGIHLRWFDDWDNSRVVDWVNAIVTRHAKVLFLVLPSSFGDLNRHRMAQMYSVPQSFFINKGLVELTLENLVMKVPSYVCFPCLKTIDFKSVYFRDDDESMKNLLSGCPVLNSLHIDRGFVADKKTFYICSPTLHDLQLDTGNYGPDLGYEVVIDAPNLRNIDLIDELGANFNIIHSSSLVKASLSIENQEGEDFRDYERRLIAILRKILHVQKLMLTTVTMRSLEYGDLDFLPMFNDVTHLDVGIFGDSMSSLRRLFHCMPNLVNLIIRKDDVAEDDWHWFDHDNDLPRCILSSLENVEVVHYEKCNYVEMGLLCYILLRSLVLKKLSIQTFCFDSEQEKDVIHELFTLQKGSSACQVEYKNMGRRASRILSLHRSYE